MNLVKLFHDKGNHASSRMTSTYWHDIWSHLSSRFDGILNEKANDYDPSAALFGLKHSEVIPIYKNVKAASTRQDRLWDVRQDLSNLSTQELAAIMHYESVRGQLRTESYIIAERNQKNEQAGAEKFDRAARTAQLTRRFQILKAMGYGAADIREMYSERKIWMTFTRHPTKDKSPAGRELFRRLTRIGENFEPDERDVEAANTIGAMLDTPLTPRAKDTYADEINDGIRAQVDYNDGMVDYFWDLENAANAVYGDGALSFIDPNMHLDVAPRKWHGGDTDGDRIPATVLFNQRAVEAHIAVQKNIELLGDAALKLLPGYDRLKPVLETFRQIESGLSPLVQDAEALVKAGSTSEIFRQAKQQFLQAFRGTPYKGDLFERGTLLTQAIMDDMLALSNDPSVDPQIRKAAWETAFLHKQNGMALGRTELRHNGGDYAVIFENLYALLREKGLTDSMSFDKLSKLQDHVQAKFFKDLMDKHGPDQIRDWLYESNSEGWSREILERFSTVSQCFNKKKMGAAIIAEAKGISPIYQQVLAESFGMKGMVHVALNEDQEMIAKAADNLKIYARVFGKRNLIERDGDYYFCVMDPQSDSQRQHGIFIRGLQRLTLQRLIDKGIETGIAVLEKLGTGCSYARGGFSPKAVTRLFINALTGMKDWHQKDKKLLRQMASFVSTTAQGRDIGLRYGTAAQVWDMLADIDANITAAVMVIDKKVQPEIVTPPAAEYTPNMRRFMEEIREKQCRRYNDELRSKQSINSMGDLRLDLYLSEVSATTISAKSTPGARPPSRNNNSIANSRAITLNIANENTETLYDGSYTLGFFLRDMHQAYLDSEITKQDIKMFINDEFYMRQTFSNSMAAMASADYEHGFDQLSQGHDTWNVGRLCDVEKRNYAGMGENTAFHAVLANDAVLATAYMEALLNIDRGDFALSEDEIIAKVYNPSDRLNILKFGEQTKKFYPDVQQLQGHLPEKRLSRAVIHEIERRVRLYNAGSNDPQALNPADPEVESLLYHIAGARRNQGPINMNNLLDQPGSGFGSTATPVMDLILQDALERGVIMRPEDTPAKNLA